VRNGRKIEDFGWLLLAGAIAIGVMAFSYLQLTDDAYISFRYAHNLVEGEGLVFNPGEYVEGYTNLLWMLLMAVPEVLGLPTYLFAAYVGAGFGLLALVETWRICRLLDLSIWGTAAAVVALGAYPEFWRAVTMGLEGGLFAFLLTLGVRLLLSERRAWAGLVGGLMFATRPDSALLLGVFALYVFLTTEDRSREDRRRGLVALIAPWLALIAVLTAWRLYYYGALIPNSITAKSPLGRSLEVLTTNALMALEYLGGFAWSAVPLTLGALVGSILGRRKPAVWLCFGALAAEIPAILVNGGDWMPHHRLLSVYAPLLAVLLGVATDRLTTRRAGAGAQMPLFARPALLGLLTLIVVCSTFFFLYSWKSPPYSWKPSPNASVDEAELCWQELSEDLKPALSPADVIAPDVIGVISYENPEVYVHDRVGITDRYLALYGEGYIPTFGKSDRAYTYYEVQPDLILSQGGLTAFRDTAAISNGTYDERYATYELTGQTNCEPKVFVVAISQEHVSRILPALAELNPQRVQVSGS
jgi:arabinofuranosyltransferase